MRFFILSLLLVSSNAMAGVDGLGKMIKENTNQEQVLHREVLKNIPDSELEQAYAESWVRLQKAEASQDINVAVQLTKQKRP
jgi:hypothetical protein